MAGFPVGMAVAFRAVRAALGDRRMGMAFPAVIVDVGVMVVAFFTVIMGVVRAFLRGGVIMVVMLLLSMGVIMMGSFFSVGVIVGVPFFSMGVIVGVPFFSVGVIVGVPFFSVGVIVGVPFFSVGVIVGVLFFSVGVVVGVPFFFAGVIMDMPFFSVGVFMVVAFPSVVMIVVVPFLPMSMVVVVALFRFQVHVKIIRIQPAFLRPAEMQVVAAHAQAGQGALQLPAVRAQVQKSAHGHIAADSRVTFQIQNLFHIISPPIDLFGSPGIRRRNHCQYLPLKFRSHRS